MLAASPAEESVAVQPVPEPSPPAPEPPPPPPAIAEPVIAPPVMEPEAAPQKPVVKAAPKTNQPPKRSKPPIEDPLARDALSLVGADPQATEYWMLAINDPGLSGHERQDLIEDLNEDGFPDPKNLTEDDLPLILSRIVLIEQLAPYSMDDVNADAFAEAYKDLLNMAGKLAP
jgi:hypothetical protein